MIFARNADDLLGHAPAEANDDAEVGIASRARRVARLLAAREICRVGEQAPAPLVVFGMADRQRTTVSFVQTGHVASMMIQL